MFEEEYFVPIVAKKQQDGQPLVYKYFAELSQEQLSEYATNEPPMSQQPIERGNMLASSVVHMQGWTGPNAAPTGSGITQKVLIKLYDKDIHAFKLNEMVTVIGVLEYTEA